MGDSSSKAAGYTGLGIGAAQGITNLFNGENPLDPFTGYGPGIGRDIHDAYNTANRGANAGIDTVNELNKYLPLILGFGGLIVVLYIVKK
jgi:hypothetical protein